MDYAEENSSWEEFVQGQLLQGGLINGVCLFSKLGDVLYSYGILANMLQADSKQFLAHFVCVHEEQVRALQEKSFHISLKGREPTSFHIHSHTKCSIYATGDHSQAGLLVGNLPYGVLLCTYEPSHHAARDATKLFEGVCNLLRS